MKNLTAFIGVVLTASLLFSSQAEAYGLFFNAGAGLQTQTNKVAPNISLTYTESGATTAASAKSMLEAIQPAAEFQFGYDALIGKHLYWGSNLFLNTSTGQKRTYSTHATDTEGSSVTNLAVNLKNKFDPLAGGIDFRLGYGTENTAIFSILGMSVTGIDTSVEVSYNITGDYPDSDYAVGNFRKIVAGVRAGVGLQHMFTENWGVYMRYVYTQYQKYSKHIETSDPVSTFDKHDALYTQSSMVSVVYSF